MTREREIVVTCGGTEGVLDVLLATLDPGDEVVLTDPIYAGLVNRVRLAGGVPVFAPLAVVDGEWRLDRDALAAAVTERTVALLMMSPSMPSGLRARRATTGRPSRRSACAHDLFLIYDAAMEALLFDGRAPVVPLDVPGMAERTVIVGSMSKAYRMIGWRVGWVAGPAVARERRRVGARLQHDRHRLRRPPRGRGGAARAAGARGARPSPSCSAAATRSSPRCRAGRSCARRAAGRCWSTSRDGLDRRRRPRRRCSRRASPRRPWTGWGGDVAARYVRFVFSAEPVARLADARRRASRAGAAPGSLSADVRGHRNTGCSPAEHRALRELHATTRQLAEPLGQARRGGRDERRSSTRAPRRRARCSPSSSERVGDAHDLHGQPAAQAVGARLAGARGISDLLLERNQAFRTALLDLQHVTTLLGYLGALARTRGDAELAAWHDGWEQRLSALEERGRAAAARWRPIRRPRSRPPTRAALGRAGARSVSLRHRGRGDRQFAARSAGPPPRNLKELRSMSVDVVVAVPAFMDMTFVGLEGLPRLGEERFAGDLVRTPGGGAITAIGTARLGLSTALAAPLGQDAAGDLIAPMLEERASSSSAPRCARTPITVVMPIGPERAMVTYDPGVRARAADVAALAAARGHHRPEPARRRPGRRPRLRDRRRRRRPRVRRPPAGRRVARHRVCSSSSARRSC